MSHYCQPWLDFNSNQAKLKKRTTNMIIFKTIQKNRKAFYCYGHKCLSCDRKMTKKFREFKINNSKEYWTWLGQFAKMTSNDFFIIFTLISRRECMCSLFHSLFADYFSHRDRNNQLSLYRQNIDRYHHI